MEKFTGKQHKHEPTERLFDSPTHKSRCMGAAESLEHSVSEVIDHLRLLIAVPSADHKTRPKALQLSENVVAVVPVADPIGVKFCPACLEATIVHARDVVQHLEELQKMLKPV